MAIVNFYNTITFFAAVCLFHCNRANGMECGSVNVARELILGGNRTLRTEWPFIVAVYETRPTKYICGGTLISVRHVLTAAHCIHRRHSPVRLTPDNIEVRLGAYNLTTENEEGAVRRNVSAIRVHLDWKPYDDKYDADIAILILSDNVTYSHFIQPICVPADVEVIDGAIINVTGTVVGWGIGEGEVNEEIPRKMVARAINNSLCYRTEPSLIQYASLRSFCAKGVDGTPNKGDSGGGFFVSDSTWLQYGIISAINTDNTGHAVANSFAIYTNVKSFKQWIVETVTQSGGEVGEWTTEVSLACSYGYASNNGQHFGYTCLLNDLEIRTERNKIASVSGSHYVMVSCHGHRKDNIDVDSIIFHSGSMFTLPEGLGNFFKKLRLLQIGNSNLTTISLKHIWRSSLKDLENLEVFIVVGNDIEKLDADCLWDLRKLRIVNLFHNKLKAIDEQTFVTNEKLQQVYLSENRLETLPTNLFSQNVLLESINLNSNSIQTIDGNIFTFNTNLAFVNLSDNQLAATLPRNLFKNNFLLEVVKLHGNSISNVDGRMFETNVRLKVVTLSSNRLQFVPQDLFRNNLLLESIYLSDNSLLTIDERIFERNEKLTRIVLSSNRLESIPRNLFENNFELRRLNLRNNSLETMDELSFKTNIQLISIDLSSNRFEFFPTNLFRNNLLLESAYFEHNFLHAMDERIFEKNEKLTSIDLSSNQLKILPQNIFRNNLLLIELNLFNNSLTALHEQIFEMNIDLVKVNVSNNSLTSISPQLFKTNLNLKIVLLSSIRLESVPRHLFTNNSLLVLLGLDSNLLTIIDGDIFETNVNLEAISLERNRLQTLPRNLFKNNPLLIFISLGFNLLTTIDENIFETNVIARRIFLAGNRLEYLPRNLFKNNPLLEFVIFTGNRLVAIEIDFTKFKNVSYISFSENICINDAIYDEQSDSDVIFRNLTEFQSLISKNCTL